MKRFLFFIGIFCISSAISMRAYAMDDPTQKINLECINQNNSPDGSIGGLTCDNGWKQLDQSRPPFSLSIPF